MKRKNSSIGILLLVAVVLLGTMISCEDKDTVAPKAKLEGPNPYNITLNERYIEYGLKDVYDNRDDSASLEIVISHEIDT